MKPNSSHLSPQTESCYVHRTLGLHIRCLEIFFFSLHILKYLIGEVANTIHFLFNRRWDYRKEEKYLLAKVCDNDDDKGNTENDEMRSINVY